jgi:serine/threonine-protein kinase
VTDITPERWDRVKKIFGDALDRESAERPLYVAQACAGDEDLLRRVQYLLTDDDSAGDFLEQPLMRLPEMGMTLPSRLVFAPDHVISDRFRITRHLASGGMGEVYQARDLQLERDVAIKVVRSRVAHDHHRVALLRQEALATARLNHPSIVTVYQIGQDGDVLYIVSELLNGVSLRTRLSSGRLPIDLAVQWARDIARALATAHDEGIIHRDLKPENVFITQDGRVKLLDFGLAKLLSRDSNAPDGAAPHGDAAPSIVMGTPGYMAPEQLQGHRADHRADIFAFGAVFYEMLTGRRAATESPEPHLGDVPARLRGVVRQSLAKIPDERFQSARDLLPLLNVPLRSTWLRRAGLAMASSIVLVTVAVSLDVAEPIRQWVSRALSRVMPIAASQSQLSFAVLPVINLSGDPQTEQVGLSIARTIARNLATVPGVTVSPRTATARYGESNRNAETALRDLGATLVLDIALERANDRFKMHVSRYQTAPADGVRLRVYNGDVLAIHRDLLRDLPGLLQTAGFRRRLGEADVARLMNLPTSNAAAHFYYFEGRSLLAEPDAAAHPDRAIAALERSLAQDPKFVAAMTSLSDAYLLRHSRTGDDKWVTRATQYAHEALAIDATDAAVHVSLGRLKQKTGHLGAATRELRVAVQQMPDSDEAHRILGLLLALQGDAAEAGRALQHAVLLRPDFWNNHFTLGFARLRARRYDEAITSYKRVTELQPNYADAFAMLGASYHRAGAIEQAIGSYAHAARIGPSATAYANLGFVYFTRGRITAALTAYRAALDKDRSSPRNWRNIGDVYARLNRSGDATSSYRTAIRLLEKQLATNPRDAGAIALLAVCEVKLERRAVAEGRVAEALVLGPKDRDVLYRAAVVYALLEQREQAIKALRAAIENGYEPADARDDHDFTILRELAEFKALVRTDVGRSSNGEGGKK